MPIDINNPAVLSALLLAAATATWYVAAHALAAAAGRWDRAMLLGGGVPGVVACVWAAVAGHGEMGLSLAIGTAVAATTLVMGLVLNAREEPVTADGDDPPTVSASRSIAFLLPASIMVLAVAISGTVTLLDATLLAVVGVILFLLADGNERATLPRSGPGKRRLTGKGAGMAVVALLGIALAVAGAGFAFAASDAAGRQFGRDVGPIFAGGLFAAFMILPLIGIGTSAAGRGETVAVQRGLVWLAVAMLTLAVPLVLLAHVGRGFVMAGADSLTAAAVWERVSGQIDSLSVPWRLWRVDAIVLCVTGVSLLPAAAGRLRMGVMEGLSLVLFYAAYLVLSVWSSS